MPGVTSMPVTETSERSAPVSRYDSFISSQLGKVERRIRLFDVLTATVVLLALFALYALIVVPLDRRLDLGTGWRWLAVFALVLTTGTFLAAFLVVPFFRQLNPYFAARRLEQLIPDAKNSLVNWLDLKDRQLPSAIRENGVVRAARDVGKAPVAQAVDGRRLRWLFGIAAALLLALGIEAIAFGPGRFANHLRRMLTPFGSLPSAEGTQLEKKEPEADQTTITLDDNRPLRFRVQVKGRVPEPNAADGVKLQYRFGQDEPYLELPLDADHQWSTILPASQLHAGGLWYRFTGGNARTDEYRIEVRPRPLVDILQVVYRNRKYLRGLDHTDDQPSTIEGMRGARVTLTARANRELASRMPSMVEG